MLRSFICSLVAVALVAGVALAEDKKAKDKTVKGTFVSFKDGTLTIKVPGKKGDEPKATEFKIADELKVVTLVGTDKKEAVAKESFKDVKEGTAVTVTLGEGDKVTAVQIGTAKKAEKGDKKADKTVSGMFASFKDGTLTIKIKGKKGDEPKPQEFKVADDVKVTTFAGEDKKEAVAKDAFKAEIKADTLITLTLGEGDKVTAVQVGKAPKKKDK